MENPEYSRQTSMCTIQGHEGTCMLHALAKIILKNVYRFVYPIYIPYEDIPKFKSCFDVLQTDRQHDYNKLLSEQKCGRAGYETILLFIYLYSIVYSFNLNKPSELETLNIGHNNVILKAMKIKPIPNLFTDDNLIAFNKIRDNIARNKTGIHFM